MKTAMWTRISAFNRFPEHDSHRHPVSVLTACFSVFRVQNFLQGLCAGIIVGSVQGGAYQPWTFSSVRKRLSPHAREISSSAISTPFIYFAGAENGGLATPFSSAIRSQVFWLRSGVISLRPLFFAYVLILCEALCAFQLHTASQSDSFCSGVRLRRPN